MQSESSHRPFASRQARPGAAARRHRGSILRRLILSLALAGLILPACASAAYKWIDEHGRVHYGDTIPPNEIHRSYEKVDKQGRVDQKVDAVPDPVQRAEQNRRAQQQAAEQEEARKRAIRDQYLIETYQDAAQVRAAYDAKLASLDSSLALAQSVVEKLGARRAALVRNAAEGERSGEATQKLEQEIRDLDQQLAHQHGYIEDRRAERLELEKTAAEDVARFEQLQAERNAPATQP